MHNVGQTGRDFKTRYEEHINDIRSKINPDMLCIFYKKIMNMVPSRKLRIYSRL
jgi:hypothetical protein